jgi:hypothetical protein
MIRTLWLFSITDSLFPMSGHEMKAFGVVSDRLGQALIIIGRNM